MTIQENVAYEFELRILKEGIEKIKKCLTLLSETEVWMQANANTNSVGNLIVHLEGNLRQYILSGIRGDADIRKRNDEFDHSRTMHIDDAVNNLIAAATEAKDYLHSIPETMLIEEKEAQGFSMTVLSMIIHVIEHFSYHVGQITYITKMIKNVDTAYYEGIDLNTKSN